MKQTADRKVTSHATTPPAGVAVEFNTSTDTIYSRSLQRTSAAVLFELMLTTVTTSYQTNKRNLKKLTKLLTNHQNTKIQARNLKTQLPQHHR